MRADPSRRLFLWLRALLVVSAIVVGGLILFLTDLDTGIRGYIRGEGLWSNGQKSAMTALTQFAFTGSETDYQRFEQSIRVPLGDKMARVELQKESPDYDRIREGFLAGRNHPDDLGRMIKMFRRFHSFPYMKEAIALWTRGDRDIQLIEGEALALRARRASGTIDPATVAATFRRLQKIDDRLAPLELQFSEVLGEGSRALRSVQIAAVALEGLILLALAMLTSRRRVRSLQGLLTQIHEREARFDAFMRNIPAVAFIKDGAGGFTWTNNRFQEIDVQRKVSHPGAGLFSHASEEELRTHERVLESNEPVEIVGALSGSSDSERSWLMIKFPIDEGRGRRLVGSVAVDITRLRRLENELERATRVSSLGTLATTVAHEFNNVLMAILPFAQFLRKSVGADERKARAADYIMQGVDRGKRITDQILTFGRPVDPSLQDVRLDSWLAQFEDSTKDLLRVGVRLQLRLPEEPVIAAIDPQQLQQVMLNLLLNANHAMPQGGTITIGLHHLADEPHEGVPAENRHTIEIVVRDEGQGIPPEVLPHIFEPLFTTKRGSGTGLGLAVVHQIIAGHGGHVSVETTVGQGTAFHLLLPQDGKSGLSHKAEAAESSLSSSKAQGMQVLLVEDDATVAAALVILLESLGAIVTHLSEGAPVAEAVDRTHFDLVVLDVALGDMSGTDVYRLLRARHQDLPILFSTGHATEATMTSIGADRHTGWLLKPYSADDLLNAIAHVSG